MNYYERHLGDYAKDAGHLSMMEHGAYSLLLDRYYTTEQAIPAEQAHRICRARSRDEKAAVDAVLAEFFTLTDGLYVNRRADQEIAKAQTKIKAARENGKAGGRPKGTQQKPTGLLPGSISVTQEKAHQTPDTRHQETPIAPKGADDPPGFAAFWSSWPQSVRKVDRKKCAEKWRRKGFEALAETIAQHVEAMKASKQWREGFEPAPMTYLSGERWADGADQGELTHEGFL